MLPRWWSSASLSLATRPPGSSGPGGHRIGALARRPAPFLAFAVPLTAFLSLGVIGIKPLGLPGLQTAAGSRLLENPRSPHFADQRLFADSFGTDPLVVMVEARPGAELLTASHFVGLAALEANLADRRATPGVKRVFGPGTVVSTLAQEVTRPGLEICANEARAADDGAARAAAAAGRSVTEQRAAGRAAFAAAARACTARLAAQYPGLGTPAVDNLAFLRQVLLEPDGSRPRPYWSWVLPDPSHALIRVRLEPNASPADVRQVLATLERAKHSPQPIASRRGSGAPTSGLGAAELTTAGDLSDLQLTVTGAPVLAAATADSVQAGLVLLLPLSLLAMLLVTMLLRVSMGIVAIPVAGLAALWTAGAAGWARLPVTPATIAVLPLVLGLSTSYLLQALNRLADEATGGPTGRVVRAAQATVPPTAVAALATLAGVLAVALSPLALVRQFALFLALGVAMAYLATLLVGIPLFALILASGGRRFLAAKAGRPTWNLLAAAGNTRPSLLMPLVLLGLAGWLALPSLGIELDSLRQLPRGDPALAQAEHVRRAVDLAGEVDLVLVGPDVTSPAALRWLDTATALISRSEPASLRPQTGLPLFLTAFNQAQAPDPELTQTIVNRLPRHFTGAVVSSDRGVARAVFSVTHRTSVQEDGRLLDRITRMTAPAPPGYRAFLAGLPVITSDALIQVRRDLLPLNLLPLPLVLGVLAVGLRSLRRALLAMLPAVVAAGWTTALLSLAHASLGPITVLLAGIVVAFASAFSVLWLTRYASGRREGIAVAPAAAAASARAGPAIVASGLALVAGFGGLALTSVAMARDLGLWGAGALLLATAAVLVFLPPAARRLLA